MAESRRTTLTVTLALALTLTLTLLPTERRLLTVVVVAVVAVVRLCSSSSLLFASACGAGHDTDGAADAARLRALPAEQRHPAAWPQGERTSEPASSPLPSGLPLSFFFSSWAAHRATTAFRYRFIIIIRMAYGHFIAIWVSLLSTLVCKRVLRSLNAAAISLLLQVRNPYVDPLNVIQAEVLRRLRTEQYDDEEEARLLRDALVITITGIANGQKNSG